LNFDDAKRAQFTVIRLFESKQYQGIVETSDGNGVVGSMILVCCRYSLFVIFTCRRLRSR